MIKRIVIELTEVLCPCDIETLFALDLELSKKDNGYELQIVCTRCNTYLSVPLDKLRALVKIEDSTGNDHLDEDKKTKPKLVLIRGGQS